jgi:hypothetical protein
MAEYLGYINPANVKANPTLDWGSVITDVQDALVNQEKLRQEKRDVAEKQSAELNKELNNISLSRSQDVNDFLLSSVYKAKDINLATDKLYRSGQIGNKQMNIIKSNIKNGFNEFDALGKNISKIQEDYAKLSESGQSSFLADYNMNQLGEALDLKNKVPYIDPTTGYMYVAPLDKNGAPDMNKLNSPKWMLSQADMPKKVDVNAEISKYTKDLGKFEEILKNPPGGIWTIDDATKRPGFSEWLEKTASAIAFNPIRQASILGDSAGSEYKLTSDVNSNDKNSIIVKKDYSTGVNTPVLTKQQEEEAKNIVKNAILQQVNRTIRQDENTYRSPVRSGGSGSNKQKDETPKNQFASSIKVLPNNKGAFTTMSGVNIKVGLKPENLPTWGIDPKGKLFVDVVSGESSGNEGWDPNNNIPINGKTTSKRYYENNDKFKKRVPFLINPNTGNRIKNIEEARSIFGNTSSTSKKAENLRSKYNY